MIPAINLWEIKSKIIKSLSLEFESLQVGDSMLKAEPYSDTSGYKLCRIDLSWRPEKQGLVMKANLSLILYYDGGYDIEADMGSISTYLMYNIDEQGKVISEKNWETDTWIFRVINPRYVGLTSYEAEGIYPAEFDVYIFPKSE